MVVLVEFALYRDLLSTDGASHVACKVPFCDVEAVAFDHGSVTVGAVSILGGMTWNVTDVNVV